MATVYALVDPIDGCVRYIGMTIHLQKRLKEHLQERYRSRKCHWVATLVRAGLRPVIEVLEEVADDLADDTERFWIASLRAAGAELLNHADGGQRVSWTPEMRREQSARMKPVHLGRKLTAEHKAKIGAKSKGRPSSWKGKKLSQAHRDKISAAQFKRSA